jgi:hypothetical protein
LSSLSSDFRAPPLPAEGFDGAPFSEIETKLSMGMFMRKRHCGHTQVGQLSFPLDDSMMTSHDDVYENHRGPEG